MEAGFNFNNKILTRYLVKCLERVGNVSKEQYSSSKGVKSIMHTVKNDCFTM